MSMSGRGCVAWRGGEKDGTEEKGIFFADGGRDIRGTRGPKKSVICVKRSSSLENRNSKIERSIHTVS